MKNATDRILILTGEPGIGKTTIVTKTVSLIKAKGYVVGGVVSREVRVGGRREGFELRDLSTEKRGTLATIKQTSGPKIGPYRVNLNDLANVGASALLQAKATSDLIVCDEVGPMELLSPEFKRAVREVMNSGKPFFGVVHLKLRDPLIDEFKSSPETKLVEVVLENRVDLPTSLANRILSRLRDG